MRLKLFLAPHGRIIMAEVTLQRHHTQVQISRWATPDALTRGGIFKDHREWSAVFCLDAAEGIGKRTIQSLLYLVMQCDRPRAAEGILQIDGWMETYTKISTCQVLILENGHATFTH